MLYCHIVMYKYCCAEMTSITTTCTCKTTVELL